MHYFLYITHQKREHTHFQLNKTPKLNNSDCRNSDQPGTVSHSGKAIQQTIELN